jgi:hypothetical protein
LAQDSGPPSAANHRPNHRRSRGRSADPRRRPDEVGERDCAWRLWLSQLQIGAIGSIQEIAEREKCSRRHVNMTISLAFLAPDLVKAAVEGRLPNGIGVARLFDPPTEWERQRKTLGLLAQIELA